MKQVTRNSLALIAAIATLAITVYLSLQSHQLTSDKPSHQTTSVNKVGASRFFERTPVTATERDALTGTGPTESNFRSQLAPCLGLDTDLEPNDFINSQIEQFAIRRSLEFENLHYLLADGRERRLQLIPHQGELQSKDQLQLKMFSVDEEGLPIPEKIPPAIEHLSIPKQRLILSEDREPIFSQRRELITLPEDQTLAVEWRQGHITEFQWSANNFSFACRDKNCKCLRVKTR